MNTARYHYKCIFCDLLVLYRNYKDKKTVSDCKSYKIIPLGQYCFPRVITSFSKLKPLKKDGEKTYPFDLAFFNEMDAVTELINTKFEKFYDDLEYDYEHKYWINKKWNAVFNHEADFTLKQFKERYNARIKNLYEDFNDKSSYKFFVIATFSKLSALVLDDLVKTLYKYNPDGNFILIIISQNVKQIKYFNEKIYVINQTEKFVNSSDWIQELRELSTIQSRKIYNKVTKELKKIILTKFQHNNF